MLGPAAILAQVSKPATQALSHPYIVHSEGVCGGRARVDGTRIPVWQIVSSIVRSGSSPEEFVEAYPHVTLAQVHDALSFYYDHREELERDLRDQEAAWRKSKRQSSR
jgi:uncharacterized protein (DUF433 family)